MMARMGPIVALFFIFNIFEFSNGVQYYGKLIGKLSELHHGVSGEVYAVDGRTLYIKDFTYDGQGPAAYFYASTGKTASGSGFRLKDENGSGEVIRRYRKEGVTIALPEGKTLNNIKIFYVWCEEFDVNFGDVKIPRNFDYPKPQKIDPLKGVHAISSDNIVIVDAQTLLIPNLSYDGEAPDAKFWVGRGPKPSPQGIRVPDENGKEVPLRRYDRKTIVLTLPGALTVFDIGHFGIWCEAFTVDFGHVQIPSDLNVPPSLKMLGVSPQSKLNCEVLFDNLAFEVRWAIAGDSIVLQLVAKLENGEYMSFGLSGEESHSVMIGGDVVVAWVDKETLKGYAEDYYLSDKSQCSGPTGSCPDNRLADNTNNIRLLNAAMVNGYSIVTYQRPLRASDNFDRPIYTNQSQAVIWAIGPFNQRKEVSFHSHWTKGDLLLEFGRTPKWNCPMPESEPPPMKPIPQYSEDVAVTESAKIKTSERRKSNGDNKPTTSRGRQTTRTRATQQRTTTPKPVPTPAPVSKRDAWDIPPIQCYEPEDGVFYAQMGPTGGKHGYPAITGHVGWGISWYINGLLIPEINVVRGKTYTFVVEGGFDPEIPAKYHPFYITDDPIGGYQYKTDEEKKSVKIFAGVKLAKDDSVQPTGVGRLCHWTQTGDLEADDFESFGAYQRTLELKCDQGEPGVVQWTPDKDTPDTVYYQCFTHRYLGWKINVLDSCDALAASSEPKPAVVDLEDEPSLRVETRVKPNDIINDDKKDKDKSTISETVPTPSIDPSLGHHQFEPFLFQPPQPQQSFFNPPIFTMSHHHPPNHGQFFTTYNPYVFDHPSYHYHHNYQQTFKPSPPIDEDGKKITTTTSTTEKTPTPKAKIEDPKSNVSDSSVISSNINSQIHLKQGFANVSGISGSNNKPPFLRRPINFQRPFGKFPSVNRPLRSPPFKKPLRPFMRLPPGVRPNPSPAFPFKIEKPFFYYDKLPVQFLNYQQRSNYVAAKQAVVLTQETSSTTTQSSTEREPEIQTAPSSISIRPVEHFHTFKLPPAHNTGFHPESVVIESGFKPIISKDFQRRMADEEEFNDYDDIGVITLNQILPKEPTQEFFEPVFVPSPEEKKLIKKRKKTSRSNPDEPMAEAAERVESFYLPPPDQPLPQEKPPKQPSNVDIDSHGVLVTYDGKILSGTSLTANIADKLNILDQRTSKSAAFIRAQPQFAPYRGELPPLGSESMQPKSRGYLSRDLDLPKTKLLRRERAAHHTPEHTEQQRLEQQQQGRSTNNTKQTNGVPSSKKVTTFVALVALFVNFIVRI